MELSNWPNQQQIGRIVYHAQKGQKLLAEFYRSFHASYETVFCKGEHQGGCLAWWWSWWGPVWCQEPSSSAPLRKGCRAKAYHCWRCQWWNIFFVNSELSAFHHAFCRMIWCQELASSRLTLLYILHLRSKFIWWLHSPTWLFDRTGALTIPRTSKSRASSRSKSTGLKRIESTSWNWSQGGITVGGTIMAPVSWLFEIPTLTCN